VQAKEATKKECYIESGALLRDDLGWACSPEIFHRAFMNLMQIRWV